MLLSWAFCDNLVLDISPNRVVVVADAPGSHGEGEVLQDGGGGGGGAHYDGGTGGCSASCTCLLRCAVRCKSTASLVVT